MSGSTPLLCVVASLGICGAIGGRTASAQTAQRSALVGRVVDPSGAPLPGAPVTLSGGAALGGARTAVTDNDGRYRFLALLPGEYVLSARADGFQRAIHPEMRLPVETTWTVDFRLELLSIAEQVDVEAPTPIIDVTTAASPAVIDRALLQNLPTGRTLTAVMNLAPGVTDNVSFGGQQNSNGVTIDGVSLVEPVFGRVWGSVQYNWLDSVQVVALGAPAEYGQSTGATINGVLRSGSNRFAGLGEAVAAVPAWTGNNTHSLEPQFQEQFAPRALQSWWDVNGQFGGPIARDRVWFFAGSGVVREHYRPFGYSGPEQAERDETQALVKLDAAPLDHLRLQGFYQHSAGAVVGERLSTFERQLETAGQRRQRNQTWNARGTWIARPDSTVEVRSGGLVGYSYFGPVDPARADGPPPVTDYFLGTLANNVLTLVEDDRQMVTTSARITHMRRIGGSLHDLAAGVEHESTLSRVFYGPPGNRIDQHFDGAYRITLLWQGEDIRTRNRRTTFYAQDRWSVGRGLTLDPGIRVESYGGRPRQGGDVLGTTPVALRFGAAWDMTSSHRTVLRAHYGRYHDMLFSQIYSWHDTAGLSERITGIMTPTGDFIEQSRSYDAIPAYPIDPDLKQSHVDQFSTGVEHQLSRDVAVEARYVARRFGNFIGYVDRRLDEWTTFVTQDPGVDGRLGTTDDGGMLTGFVPYWWPAGERDLVISNPEGAFRRYDAVQLIARKRQSDNWEAQASYTWSRTSGPIPGQEFTSATYSYLSPLGFGGSPAGTTSLRATPVTRSQFDYSELKLLGWVRLPGLGGTVLGGVVRRHNGERWHRIVATSDPSTGWFTSLTPEAPFSRITPTLALLDVRLEKTLLLRGERRTLGLYLDAMNAANVGTALSYIRQSGPRFGFPRTWTAPRTLRLGLRYTS
jgi:hypothetical protein